MPLLQAHGQASAVHQQKNAVHCSNYLRRCATGQVVRLAWQGLEAVHLLMKRVPFQQETGGLICSLPNCGLALAMAVCLRAMRVLV